MRILLAFALLGASQPLDMRTIDDGMPPVRMQGNSTVTVRFVTEVNTRAGCGIAPPGYTFLGCTREDNTIIMPNPCQFPNQPWAKVMCHEVAHAAHQWPATHDR